MSEQRFVCRLLDSPLPFDMQVELSVDAVADTVGLDRSAMARREIGSDDYQCLRVTLKSLIPELDREECKRSNRRLEETAALMRAQVDSPQDWASASMMQTWAPCVHCKAEGARWFVFRYVIPQEWQIRVHCDKCRQIFTSPTWTVRLYRQAFRFAWIHQEGWPLLEAPAQDAN